MSIFSFIAIILLDYGREVLSCIFSGVITWVVMAILGVVKLIKKVIKEYKYKSLISCPDGKIRYISCNKVTDFLDTHDNYSLARFDKFFVQEMWSVLQWDKECRSGDWANVRYAPRSVWKGYEKLNLKKNKK